MNNEIGRKITSLTLMTIMVAGGLTFAIPGAMPEAEAANANLIVSTTTFGGPMIVEVVIDDPNLDDDDVESMPDVTVDGHDLVMVQGSGGKWYGYFGATDMIETADDTFADFGNKEAKSGGVIIDDIVLGGFDSSAEVFTDAENVLRSFKDPTSSAHTLDGQVLQDASSAKWPFIQTFVFTDDANIDVVYETTPTQTETIVYEEDDMDDLASYSTDRTTYPHGADVHLVIKDMQLNIDPTDEDVWTFNVLNNTSFYGQNGAFPVNSTLQSLLNYGDNGFFAIDKKDVLEVHPNDDSVEKGVQGDDLVTVVEDLPNSGLFENTDSDNDANIRTTTNTSLRDVSGVIDYNDDPSSILVGFFTGLVNMDEGSIDDEWSSGEPITVIIHDEDQNTNTKVSDDFEVSDASFTAIPTIRIGEPITIDEDTVANTVDNGNALKTLPALVFDPFSSRLIVNSTDHTNVDTIYVNFTNTTIEDLENIVNGTNIKTRFNYDISGFGFDSANSVDIYLGDNSNKASAKLASGDDGFVVLDETHTSGLDDDSELRVVIEFNEQDLSGDSAFVIDFFSYSGEDARNNAAIYRFEAEETKTDSGVFTGTVEYLMLNQINMWDDSTFLGLETIGSDLDVIVHEDLSDEDAVSMIFADIDGQGQPTQVSDKVDAPTDSAEVTFDAETYKVADTVLITITDSDLNTDSNTLEIYTVVSGSNIIGHPDHTATPDLSRLLDIEIDGKVWTDECATSENGITGLYSSMRSLKETKEDSGIFTGTFQIPKRHCTGDGSDDHVSVTGLDIKVNYVDFRDASGEVIEIGDSAGIRANTGSVALDRTVYPVPFGVPSEAIYEDESSSFAIHGTGIPNGDISADGKHLTNGDLTIHIRVNDPDYDVSASGADEIAEKYTENGPVKVMVSRGANTVVLGTAGAEVASGSLITLGDDVVNSETDGASPSDYTREFGPIAEIAPDAGIFEFDLVVRYTDGPSDNSCPASIASSLEHIEGSDNNHCILQGDILQVEYTDPTDASGDPNTVTDSATFDLRNGVLQSDKSVYIIGSDMILTLIEPDFDLDNDQAETYDLDLIEWDSDSATVTMGNEGGHIDAFDPEPSALRETGDSTGIFQIVVEIPEELNNNRLERGEEIKLEYTDWGPSGADYVGDEDEDVNLNVFTSNFGATVELDQKVYSWTDKVYITIVAPDHNFDSDLVDEIGDSSKDPIKVSTRGNDLNEYKLVETGTDTGIFTGEVILTGFSHDADGDITTGDDNGSDTNPRTEGSGPTGGFLESKNDDGLSISFEFSEDESVIGSALIRWNIGEVSWLEASYPASGTGVVRIIDPDMNLDPEAVDNFDANVWSDSDAGGVDLTVTETNEATGIFEGTVFFTTTGESSGHRLRVAEGDTVTAEYQDNTLPDPYTNADELDITATSLIGTVVPPLERAPAANLRTVDAFGNSLDSVSVDQQVQISADLANGQDREQSFAYLVQIQDANGITVSLAWITGSLSPGQSFSPALSWIPTDAGKYTATAFVWESVDNPTALSPPVTASVTVS